MKHNKAIKTLSIITLTSSLLYTAACSNQHNTQAAHKTEFTDLPVKTQKQIKRTQTTITSVQAKAISSTQAVNTDDKEHIITDNKANFKKDKLYRLTFTGDWLTDVQDVK